MYARPMCVSLAPGEVVFPDKFSDTHLVQILSPFVSASRQCLGRSTFTNYGLQHEASSLHESGHTAWRSRSSSVSKRMRELILLTTHTLFLTRLLNLTYHRTAMKQFLKIFQKQPFVKSTLSSPLNLLLRRKLLLSPVQPVRWIC